MSDVEAKDLSAQIQELVDRKELSHSLSTDTLQKFLAELDQLRAENAAFKEQVSKLNNTAQHNREGLRRLEDRCRYMDDEIKAVKLREDAVEDRERKHWECATELKYVERQVDDHKGMLNLLLKNQTIVTRVQGNIPIGVEGMTGHTDQYGNVIPGYGGTVQQGDVNTTQTTGVDSGKPT